MSSPELFFGRRPVLVRFRLHTISRQREFIGTATDRFQSRQRGLASRSYRLLPTPASPATRSMGAQWHGADAFFASIMLDFTPIYSSCDIRLC